MSKYCELHYEEILEKIEMDLEENNIPSKPELQVKNEDEYKRKRNDNSICLHLYANND